MLKLQLPTNQPWYNLKTVLVLAAHQKSARDRTIGRNKIYSLFPIESKCCYLIQMEDGLCGFVGTKQRLLIKDITKRFKLTILLTFQDFTRGKNKSTTQINICHFIKSIPGKIQTMLEKKNY